MEIRDELLKLGKEKAKKDETGEMLSAVVKQKLGIVSEQEMPFTQLRASGVFGLCPRRAVFSMILPMPPPVVTKNNMSMQLRMDTGTFLHEYFQDFVLGPAGVLFGNWKRSYTDKDGVLLDEKERMCFMPPPTPHPESVGWCGRWKFEEHHIVNDELHLSGHHDGWIDKQRMKEYLAEIPFTSEEPVDLVLLEIKSTDDNGLRKMKDAGGGPGLLEDYKTQATIYQRSVGVTETLFFYIDRKYFSMFTFTYKGEDKYWDYTKEKSEMIFGSVDAKKLPPKHVECSFKKSKRAKECPFIEFCFCEDADSVWDIMETKED